jgi:hypothetical protein
MPKSRLDFGRVDKFASGAWQPVGFGGWSPRGCIAQGARRPRAVPLWLAPHSRPLTKEAMSAAPGHSQTTGDLMTIEAEDILASRVFNTTILENTDD